MPSSSSRTTAQRWAMSRSSLSVQRSRKKRSASSRFSRRRIASKSASASGVRQSSAMVASAVVVPCYRSSVLKRYHGDTDGASGFDVLPAIDLRGGRVVRLEQGDFGARDGVLRRSGRRRHGVRRRRGALAARRRPGRRTDGVPAHGAVIEAILAAVGDGVGVEVAGGLRDEAAVEAVLATGAARAVVGTAALRDPASPAALWHPRSERVAVALDVRDGQAVGEGWSEARPASMPRRRSSASADVGVATFEVTAIERDGLLGGPGP